LNRIKIFIDGFNLYHVLDNHREYHQYKWLDFSKLASLFIKRDEQIVGINYFTALATWNPGKVERHKIFITALRSRSIKVIYGQFQKVTKRCRGTCGEKYETHEEKKTDVNIAIDILKSAVLDEYDTAMIISADSDLIPVVEAVRELFPGRTSGGIIGLNLSFNVARFMSFL
jgi:uncharacterized LabA/DUF88 family protein